MDEGYGLALVGLVFAIFLNVWWLWRKRTILQIEWLEMKIDDEDAINPAEIDISVNGKKVTAKRK